MFISNLTKLKEIKMKIAYVFGGHSRTWEQCYQSFFDNIYSVAPGDIYIHTWERKNSAVGSWWNGWNDLDGEKLTKSMEYTDVNGLIEKFKPVNIIVEQHPVVDVSHLSQQSQFSKAQYGNKFQYYSMRRSFEEACARENYDVFFNLRLDLFWKNRFDINELQSDKLFFPQRKNFDLFSIANFELMDSRLKIAYDIEDFWYQNERWKSKGLETILQEYYSIKGLSNKIANTKLDCDMIRLF
jgi:hypothetical protein